MSRVYGGIFGVEEPMVGFSSCWFGDQVGKSVNCGQAGSNWSCATWGRPYSSELSKSQVSANNMQIGSW